MISLSKLGPVWPRESRASSELSTRESLAVWSLDSNLKLKGLEQTVWVPNFRVQTVWLTKNT